MEIDYKGKHYDTYSSKDRLQLIEDEGFQKKFVDEYFYEPEEVMKSSKLDLAYNLALMSAKYEDIISNLTNDFSKAGTYPEWVIDSADKRAELIYGDDE